MLSFNFKYFLILFLGLLPAYLIRFNIGGVPTTLLETFFLILFAVWLIKENGYRLDVLRSMGPYRSAILVLLSAGCFAVAFGGGDTFSALGALKSFIIEPVLLFLMVRSTFTTDKDWERGIQMLAFSAGIISVVAIVQALTGAGIPVPWDIEHRATSIFPFPNAVGLFVAPVVALCLSLRSRGFTLIAILGVLGILAAQTEAALVALPVGLLIALFTSNARRTTRAIGFSLGVTTLLIALMIPMTRSKLLLDDFSGHVRRSQWKETATMLVDYPVFGAGLAGYPSTFAPYHHDTQYEIFQFPHNIVLNIWVELGLLGLLAFTLFAIATFRGLRPDDPLVMAAFAALAVMVIHGLVDVPFFKNDLAMLTAFLLAMIAKERGSSSFSSSRT